MLKIIKIIKKYLTPLIIVLLALFWRFWDFENRWVLNQDQARDAIIGLHSISNNLIPEVGPYSSSGPYNFGPIYYWFVVFWEKIIPTVNGAWVGFGILSMISVYLYYLTGEWIAGIMAALAVGMVSNSTDMLNTVIVGFSSALGWYGTKKIVDTNKWQWGIIVGIGVGLSINFHFQSLGLLAIPLAIIIVNKYKFIKRLWWGIMMGFGLILTFIPMIVFDIKRNGIWINSVIEYYTVGVNKFYVPVRWLTEIRDFWPQLFGNVTVGIGNFGYVWIILGIKILMTKRTKINKFCGVVLLTLVIDVFLMRNYKGTRSPEYMIFMHGTIVLICSWITGEYYKLNKYIGLLILCIFVVLAGMNNWNNIKNHPSQSKSILDIKNELESKIGGEIRVEEYMESDMVALPIFYLYYRENRISETGTKISFCDGNRYSCPTGENILKNNYRVYIDNKRDWSNLTPENIYDRLMVNYGKK